MNCQQFIERLDDYLDGGLDSAERQMAVAHAHRCDACGQRLARRRALRAALQEMPGPTPRSGFFKEAFRRAERAHRVPVWRQPYTVGAALAAGLALWIGFGWLPNTPRGSSEKLTSVTMTLHEPRVVQIAFNADNALPQAVLDIKLPDGVEIQGYPGQRQIRWQTDLARGANVLSLPLLAISGSGGVMLAHVEHGARSTALSVQLRVNDRSRSSVVPAAPEVADARV